MDSQKSRIGKFVHWIAPNAIWDVIKWLGGSSMVASFGHLLWAEFHRNKADWYSIAAYFGVGVALILVGTVLQRRSDDKGHPATSPAAEPYTEPSPSPSELLGLVPIQIEILSLVKDLKQLLKGAGPAPIFTTKNPGPMPKGANVHTWMEQQQIETNAWMDTYSEWSRKLIYKYKDEFSERVKKIMNALGATTGMVVVSLEPYAHDVRPGEDFQQLLDILLDFFVKLEGGRGLPPVKPQAQIPNPPESLALLPYALTLVKLGKHTPAHPLGQEEYRDKVQFVIKNSGDQKVDIWAPLWESIEVSAQTPLLSRFIKEGMEGYAGASVEEAVVKLEPSREIQGWTGLVQPSSGDGLEIRLAARNTGYLLFPLKVAGKMRYARLKI